MAQDVYVMPLWRFKAGFFRTALESKLVPSLTDSVTVVGMDGILNRDYRWKRWKSWRARRQVKALADAVSKANGDRVSWRDDGPVACNEQFHFSRALNCFAHWEPYRDQFPRFEFTEGQQFDDHPALKLPARPNRWPHLAQHDLYAGYFLPCAFEKVARVEPYRPLPHLVFDRPVGSAVRLLEHLEEIEAMLAPTGGFSRAHPDQRPLQWIRDGVAQLKQIARRSVQHQLPMIFCG